MHVLPEPSRNGDIGRACGGPASGVELQPSASMGSGHSGRVDGGCTREGLSMYGESFTTRKNQTPRLTCSRPSRRPMPRASLTMRSSSVCDSDWLARRPARVSPWRRLIATTRTRMVRESAWESVELDRLSRLHALDFRTGKVAGLAGRGCRRAARLASPEAIASRRRS